MCVNNPQPFQSDTPITAYKVMMKITPSIVQSAIAGNMYQIGYKHTAELPMDITGVSVSSKYSIGFHAYENLEDAQLIRQNFSSREFPNRGFTAFRIVEVELSELTFKGTENVFLYTVYPDGTSKKLPVLVANKCAFIKMVE